jgi:hypothetical protein
MILLSLASCSQAGSNSNVNPPSQNADAVANEIVRDMFDDATPAGLAKYCIQSAGEIDAIIDGHVKDAEARGNKTGRIVFLTFGSKMIRDANKNPDLANALTRYPPDGKYDFREIAATVRYMLVDGKGR